MTCSIHDVIWKTALVVDQHSCDVWSYIFYLGICSYLTRIRSFLLINGRSLTRFAWFCLAAVGTALAKLHSFYKMERLGGCSQVWQMMVVRIFILPVVVLQENVAEVQNWRQWHNGQLFYQLSFSFYWATLWPFLPVIGYLGSSINMDLSHLRFIDLLWLIEGNNCEPSIDTVFPPLDILYCYFRLYYLNCMPGWLSESQNNSSIFNFADFSI